jgi:hypothetical protein
MEDTTLEKSKKKWLRLHNQFLLFFQKNGRTTQETQRTNRRRMEASPAILESEEAICSILQSYSQRLC